ncbi:MAG: aminopeptidase [Lachnospiraceae bacterium]|nr:aminopeptidase [Candidatus Equihabitans merdae]
MTERYELAVGRLNEIVTENHVPEPFRDFFRVTGEFLLTAIQGPEAENKALYADILPEHYGMSYANPAYACQMLGPDYGSILSAVYAEWRGIIPLAFEGREEGVTILLELFLQIYGMFDDDEVPSPRSVKNVFNSYLVDYLDLFMDERTKESLDPTDDFAVGIIENADLSKTDYLTAFGEYVSPETVATAEYLVKLPQEIIDKMARVFTEGYRTGFIKAGKPLAKKRTVNIRFELGFERVVKAAIAQFREMGLEPILTRAAYRLVNKRQALRIGYYGAGPNLQYDYDHRQDIALVLDRDFVSAKLRVTQQAYERFADAADVFGGPACMETFGQASFEPVQTKEALTLSESQQALWTELSTRQSQIVNRYIKGEERSFTIVAWPLPSIGPDFEAIFNETIGINTLSSEEYDGIQQHIIDALDQGEYVHVKGQGSNETDLTIHLHHLTDSTKETNFENCTADVNIPVGEVFTSPVLKGTEGCLHVSGVYLNGLFFKNLKLTIKDGMISDYSCDNYEDPADGRRMIEDNILFAHESLPMGEFAIGTNTAAYVMGRHYNIEEKLPILIAEKTGPHFAFGDTCYSYEEDSAVFNSDGKEIIARDNEVSALRKTDPLKAYFSCHTDITIPYDELDSIAVERFDGTSVYVIKDGLFAIPGTEQLNKPLTI